MRGTYEDFFRCIIESLRDVVTVLDKDLKIIYANPAAEDFFSCPLRELLGGKITDMILAQDVPRAEDCLGRALGGWGERSETILRFRTADGALRFARVGVRELMEKLPIKGILLEICDVSEAERMRLELERKEEELREFRTITEAANYGVGIADLDGYLLYVNPYFAAVHGYRPEDLLGKNLLVFHNAEQREEVQEINRRLVEEGSYSNLEVWHARKDGSVFPMLMNAVVIRDEEGSPLYMAATALDISERKQWEEELEAYRHRLEEMVEERTSELAHANWKLQEEIRERVRAEEELRLLNQELDAFAHTVSHDLRGTVSVIDGFARTALQASETGDREEERECLEKVIQAAERMDRFIEALLAYARAAHSLEEGETVNLERVVKEVTSALQEEVTRRGASLVVGSGLPTVAASEVALYQVLYNLLSNALKFSSGDREPRVELTCRCEGGKAVMAVKDNGVGILEEDRERIFLPFVRCGQPELQGLGIGLATVKRVVEGWGGEVWVESTPGEGSTFFFTAPLA